MRTAVFLCRCECGAEKEFTGLSIIHKEVASCGCARVSSALTHGMSDDPEYKVWENMISRCENPKATWYEHYGGRGITICARWRESFERFFEDMGRRPTARHTIERENNDGNYEPGNCTWATRKEQQLNRRNARLLTFNGETANMSEWAKRTGMPFLTIWNRIALGWSPERALTEPVHRKKPRTPGAVPGAATMPACQSVPASSSTASASPPHSTST